MGVFRSIKFVTKEGFEKSRREHSFSVESEAAKVIDAASDSDILALRVRINSPMTVESAELLSEIGLRKIATLPTSGGNESEKTM
jgi:hypothetical protein